MKFQKHIGLLRFFLWAITARHVWPGSGHQGARAGSGECASAVPRRGADLLQFEFSDAWSDEWRGGRHSGYSASYVLA